ncbi:hypothetical protein PVK06_030777 [Gossypium arboreum]|uniref:Uncharacterized protein n=1 Tax=Gossypium arboreum TaxID=29729 RepID=A0ABR0NRR9_GOSAR|nr:hypothetical protein PVK06_030777 [Gossypium arboreum]
MQINCIVLHTCGVYSLQDFAKGIVEVMLSLEAVRASDANDEWGPDKEEPVVTESPGVDVVEEKKLDDVGEIESLKKALVDLFYRTVVA